MHDNREDIKSLPLIWHNLMRQRELAIECALPAVVVSYDRDKNLVTARPAVNRVLAATGESVKRTEVIVPCFNPCGGDIGINFPLKAGNTGWLIAADRDTTNFKASRRVSSPQSLDLHRFAFGFFVPDQIHGFDIAAEDNDALVIQSLDGLTKIAVDDDGVRVKTSDGTAATLIKASQDGVEIMTTGAVDVSAQSATVALLSSATITAATSISVSAPSIAATGEFSLTGNMTATGDITAGTVSLKSHVHLDPQEETVITGRPQE